MYVTHAMEVIPMIEAFRKVGLPVERELMKAKLPDDIEAHPGGYISTVHGGLWSLACHKLADIEDLGWHLYAKQDCRRMSVRWTDDLMAALTLQEQLDALLRSMRREANYHSNLICYTDREARIIFPNPDSISEMELRVSEWGRILDIIHLVRSAAGQNWSPRAIGFVAKGLPCDEAQEALGNTRFFGSQTAAWISVPIQLLSTPAAKISPVVPSVGVPKDAGADLHGADLPTTLRAALTPYLSSGRPSVDRAAALAGMSRRTLQRRLAEHGLSYSRFLDQCAFDVARDLLGDRQHSITDIALSVGYDDPSHFSRAFRRISGMTPTQFRKSA